MNLAEPETKGFEGGRFSEGSPHLRKISPPAHFGLALSNRLQEFRGEHARPAAIRAAPPHQPDDSLLAELPAPGVKRPGCNAKRFGRFLRRRGLAAVGDIREEQDRAKQKVGAEVVRQPLH